MNLILSEVERVLEEGRRQACYCDAYEFPHRVGGGRCRKSHPVAMPAHMHYWGDERDEDLRLFDRAEARAINAERARLQNA